MWGLLLCISKSRGMLPLVHFFTVIPFPPPPASWGGAWVEGNWSLLLPQGALTARVVYCPSFSSVWEVQTEACLFLSHTFGCFLSLLMKYGAGMLILVQPLPNWTLSFLVHVKKHTFTYLWWIIRNIQMRSMMISLLKYLLGCSIICKLWSVQNNTGENRWCETAWHFVANVCIIWGNDPQISDRVSLTGISRERCL